MIRLQAAWRAMWRCANSLIMRAAPMASTVNCRLQVAALTGWRDRPSRSDWVGAKVSASHPVALLTRTSTGPNCSSAASKSRADVAGSDRSASTAAALPLSSTMRAMSASAPWHGCPGMPAGLRDRTGRRPAGTHRGLRSRGGPGPARSPRRCRG
jgi:hypothetical protein